LEVLCLGVKVVLATAWFPEQQKWKLVHCMKVRLAKKALRDASIFYLTYQASVYYWNVSPHKRHIYMLLEKRILESITYSHHIELSSFFLTFKQVH
jgi:hypothetical protein